MNVRLLYFAVLRDITGTNQTEMTVRDGAKAADVWQSLRDRYSALAEYRNPPMIAINENYATPETLLRDGDELAFIPPVAGG